MNQKKPTPPPKPFPVAAAFHLHFKTLEAEFRLTVDDQPVLKPMSESDIDKLASESLKDPTEN
jgi:hypothetical protein